ncbi:hypothetical protein JHW43_001444 [Diplocarpon mali]|nr:hypothetical protein JHW43_001444 [Diplocarpon mali]
MRLDNATRGTIYFQIRVVLDQVLQWHSFAMAEASFADAVEQLVPRAQRSLTTHTSLAKKYGHPVKTINYLSHRVLKSPTTKRSGFTPLLPIPVSERNLSTPALSPASQRHRALVGYQTRRFWGFSARELQALGAVAGLDTGAGSSTLDAVAKTHVLYQRTQWETIDEMGAHAGPVAIRGGIEGFWVAENPVVWNALQPSLLLASLLITKAAVWDALLLGEFRDIPKDRIPPGKQQLKLKSFHARDPRIRERPSEKIRLDSQLRLAAQRIKLRIVSGYADFTTGLAKRERWVCGGTARELAAPSTIMINIALEIIQPLLTLDLNAAEKMACQFKIATTLVHETAHAVWAYRVMMTSQFDDMADVEPYFENEVLAELGWSLEDKLWGGEPMDLLPPEYSTGGPGLPSAGIVKTNWSVDRHHTRAPVLEPVEKLPEDVDDPFTIHDYYPIPTTWVASLFEGDLWASQSQAFGAEATLMKPSLVGTRAQYDPQSLEEELIGFARAKSDLDSSLPLDRSMSAAEQTRVRAENAQRQQAQDVLRQMTSRIVVRAPEMEDADDPDPPEPVYECARWDAIAQYMCAHRAPGDLALDTLDFPMPEQTMFRHVHDDGLGMPGITPDEFRDFLRVCNQRKLLFSYRPFPGAGTLRRIPTGWPPAPVVRPRRKAPVDGPTVQDLSTLLRDGDFQENVYRDYGEFRDVDFEHLRNVVNTLSTLNIGYSEMELIVTDMAVDAFPTKSDRTSLALGAKGCARMRWPILQRYRDAFPSDVTAKMLAEDEAVMRAAAAEAAQQEEERVARDLREMEADLGAQAGVGLGADEGRWDGGEMDGVLLAMSDSDESGRAGERERERERGVE